MSLWAELRFVIEAAMNCYENIFEYFLKLMRNTIRIFLRFLQAASSSAGIPRVISRLTRSIIKRCVKYGPLRQQGYTLSLYGVWLLDQWNDATFKFCANASYGFFYSDWIECLDECAFIDIGSNQGLYSLIAAKNHRIKKIYAFEPQPEVFSRLKKNIARNNANQIKAFPFAISNLGDELEMRIKDGHSGAATLRDTSVSGGEFGRSIRITAVGKYFLDSAIEVPDNMKIAIKIDTEGHEAQVLAELMESALWDRVFNIFYEIDEKYIDNIKILDDLKKCGFSIIHQNGKKPHYDLMLQRTVPFMEKSR
jgi:FkbM family methyltransferase